MGRVGPRGRTRATGQQPHTRVAHGDEGHGGSWGGATGMRATVGQQPRTRVAAGHGGVSGVERERGGDSIRGTETRLTWKHSQYFLRQWLFLQWQPLLWRPSSPDAALACAWWLIFGRNADGLLRKARDGAGGWVGGWEGVVRARLGRRSARGACAWVRG